MFGPTKEVTKSKLKHFLTVIRNVLETILQHNGKGGQTKYQMKAMILFKKEDLQSSQILDYGYENDDKNGELVYTYEKFI